MLLEECVYFPVLKSSQTFLKALHLSQQITKTLIMLVSEDNSFHCTFSTNPECISKWFKLQKHSLSARKSTMFLSAWLLERTRLFGNGFYIFPWALSPPGLKCVLSTTWEQHGCQILRHSPEITFTTKTSGTPFLDHINPFHIIIRRHVRF